MAVGKLVRGGIAFGEVLHAFGPEDALRIIAERERFLLAGKQSEHAPLGAGGLISEQSGGKERGGGTSETVHGGAHVGSEMREHR
jgi:hypothetical protein